ncbi:ROK family transcriptional regulator [Paenarthrobacter sp. DKR-5]|uniref:ROK family protein n=1 Tax=Paenarthrobacter sp. DKR-5 TaxID=2835535 RepID=UPI001BDD8842|nr:ROK family protein [Paenarthrobacter sp. DKR-5]MBT1004179.1 ROK family transcriptional regulator [Paenarthrobacter sp. DKR-5]
MLRTSLMHGVQASHLRRINERAVLEHLRTGAFTAPELADRTGLSKPTIGTALRTLQSADLVRDRGFRVGRSGQAPVEWGINETAGFVLAVDVGTQWVRLKLGNLAGETVAARRAGSGSATAASILAALDRSLAELLAEAGVARSAIVFTVVGSPGVVDPVTGSINHASNLPGWDDPSTLGELRARLGDRCVIMKDVYLSALGETARRGGPAAEFVLFSIGRGVGSAVVHEGRPLTGARGAAGEIAFLPMTSGTAGGAPSVRGSFEEATSADAMLERAAELGGAFSTVEELVDAWEAGDGTAEAVMQREVELTTYALSALVVVVDPPLVVLAGSVGLRGGARFATAVRQALGRVLPFGLPAVEPSLAGEDATLDGALDRALDLGWARLLDVL